MELTFWGVRGSYPIGRPDNIRYGGNSTCLHVRTLGGGEWIMDGGSGIYPLGHSLMRREFGRGEGFARIVIGHTHWDHILGFPFFEPFFVAGNRFEIYSAGQSGEDIRNILAGQQTLDNFPVPFEAFQADIKFYTLSPGDELLLDGTRVVTVQLNHPGITLGYRLETSGVAGATAVIYTDTARIEAVRLGDDMEDSPGYAAEFHSRLCEHAEGADLLVHDAHFTEEEIKGKEHWGHSTAVDAVKLARETGAKRLALFHHAPEHDDNDVDRQVATAREFAGDDVEVFAATEGESHVLGGLG